MTKPSTSTSRPRPKPKSSNAAKSTKAPSRPTKRKMVAGDGDDVSPDAAFVAAFMDTLGIGLGSDPSNNEVLIGAVGESLTKKYGSVDADSMVDEKGKVYIFELMMMEIILVRYASEGSAVPEGVRELLDGQLGSTFLSFNNSAHDNTTCVVVDDAVMRILRPGNAKKNNGGSNGNASSNNSKSQKCNPRQMYAVYTSVVDEFLRTKCKEYESERKKEKDGKNEGNGKNEIIKTNRLCTDESYRNRKITDVNAALSNALTVLGSTNDMSGGANTNANARDLKSSARKFGQGIAKYSGMSALGKLSVLMAGKVARGLVNIPVVGGVTRAVGDEVITAIFNGMGVYDNDIELRDVDPKTVLKFLDNINRSLCDKFKFRVNVVDAPEEGAHRKCRLSKVQSTYKLKKEIEDEYYHKNR